VAKGSFTVARSQNRTIAEREREIGGYRRQRDQRERPHIANAPRAMRSGRHAVHEDHSPQTNGDQDEPRNDDRRTDAVDALVERENKAGRIKRSHCRPRA
jgi:hypothetical protein